MGMVFCESQDIAFNLSEGLPSSTSPLSSRVLKPNFDQGGLSAGPEQVPILYPLPDLLSCITVEVTQYFVGFTECTSNTHILRFHIELEVFVG